MWNLILNYFQVLFLEFKKLLSPVALQQTATPAEQVLTQQVNLRYFLFCLPALSEHNLGFRLKTKSLHNYCPNKFKHLNSKCLHTRHLNIPTLVSWLITVVVNRFSTVAVVVICSCLCKRYYQKLPIFVGTILYCMWARASSYIVLQFQNTDKSTLNYIWLNLTYWAVNIAESQTLSVQLGHHINQANQAVSLQIIWMPTNVQLNLATF